MTGHEYLYNVLVSQAISSDVLNQMRATRNSVESVLRAAFGSTPRVYYAGSYGKDTMISAYHDLDIVIYFPPTTPSSLSQIFYSVQNALQQARYNVQPKNVALRLPYNGGFSVDVVPGRARDDSYLYASLFKSETNSWFQTSIKTHIDTVKNSGYRDVMKLLKLWNVRNNLQVRSIALELLTIRALSNFSGSGLDYKLLQVLLFIRDNIETVRLEDPANSNNIISDMITPSTKAQMKYIATRNTTGTVPWQNIVW